MTSFDQEVLRYSIKRLPEFDAAWPTERVAWWFETFFALLDRCRDLQKPEAK